MFPFQPTRVLLILSLLLASTPVAATPGSAPASVQTWIASYGGAEAKTVIATADGGYAVGAGGQDAWVTKLNAAGDVQWQKSYGEYNLDSLYSLIATVDGGYAFAGLTFSFGAGNDDVWVVKLDASGNIQWQKTYGGIGDEIARSLIATADGGYAVAGETYSFSAGWNDAWVLKLDADGAVQWQKSYGGSDTDVAWSLLQAADGGYAFAGSTRSFGPGGINAWVLKLDASGTVQWQKAYGGSQDDYGYSVVAAADGGYAVAGYTTSFGAGQQDVWVLKLDANGAVEWQRAYGGTSDDWTWSLVATVDGGYAVAGSARSFSQDRLFRVWVLKLDAGGNVQWQNSYGGTSHDYAYTVTTSPNGGYVVAGSTNSFGTGGPMWVLKLDADGRAGEMCPVSEATAATVTSTTAEARPSSVRGVDSNAVVGVSTAQVSDTVTSPSRQCLDDTVTMHIASITPRYQPVSQGYRIGVQVAVVDPLANPVAGAEVALTIRLPDGRRVRLTGLTGPEGHFSPVGRTQLTGTYTFVVTGVSKAGYVYDQSQDSETVETLTIP